MKIRILLFVLFAFILNNTTFAFSDKKEGIGLTTHYSEAKKFQAVAVNTSPLSDQTQLKDLLTKIQKSNLQKSSDCKAALFLAGATEYGDEAFSVAAHGYKILHLAKTHYVMLKLLTRGKAVGTTIANCKKELKDRPIDVLILSGHGRPDSIKFGEGDSSSHFYSEKDVKGADFALLEGATRIILDSCSTGKGLAQKIASVQTRPVIAPITNNRILDTVFIYCCEEHGVTMKSSSEKSETITRAFQKKGAKIEEKEAHCKLVDLHEFYKEQFAWHLDKAEKGDLLAQTLVAQAYKEGSGIEQDDRKAVKWYQELAKSGDANALCNLGVCYSIGKGVKQDYKKAVFYYAAAAAKDHAEAIYDLGICYSRGDGVEENDEEAVQWFEKAAHLGDENAQCILARCYLEGIGVEENPQVAFQWFEESAERGYAEAQYMLGDCYYYGDGVEKDLQKAIEWYTQAAKQGDEEAQYRLEQIAY